MNSTIVDRQLGLAAQANSLNAHVARLPIEGLVADFDFCRKSHRDSQRGSLVRAGVGWTGETIAHCCA